jgi:hypothetical protein
VSYDLLVFEAHSVPRERAAFMEWWNRTAQWGEGHSYDDPAVTTPELRAWYDDLRATFRNLNGPGCPTDEELELPGMEDRLTDYSIGRQAIYAAFPWPEAETAYSLVRELAVKHRVGFFDASCDEPEPEIYFPGDELRPPSEGAWRTVAADFRSGDLSKYLPQEEPPKRSWLDFFRRNK